MGRLRATDIKKGKKIRSASKPLVAGSVAASNGGGSAVLSSSSSLSKRSYIKAAKKEKFLKKLYDSSVNNSNNNGHTSKKKQRQEEINRSLTELEKSLQHQSASASASASSVIVKPALIAIKRSKMKKSVAIREAERMKLVQQHPQFISNPLDAVRMHIEQTIRMKQQNS